MESSKPNYSGRTVGKIMSTDITICRSDTLIHDVLARVSQTASDHDHVYLVDQNGRLNGFVPLKRLLNAGKDRTVSELSKTPPAALHPHDDQELAVINVVKQDLDSVPVVDKDQKLLGVVTAKSIIDVMHAEHIEDVLFATGIRREEGTSFFQLASARVIPVIKSRAPWLIAGALVGITIGLVLRHFDAAIEKTLSLAYFVPVVAYIAASVSTQSEAITVRALAMLKLNYAAYLIREVAIGFCLGIILGSLAGLGALIISSNNQVALVVGLSLLAASTVASAMAALIPIIFKALGKDPALGSGPLATALQDILSIMIYFVLALLIIGV